MELAAPQSVADDDDRRRARSVIALTVKGASESRLESEEIEVVRRHALALGGDGVAAAAEKGEVAADRRDVREDVAGLAPGCHLLVGQNEARLGAGRVNERQFRRRVNRERADQNRVNDAEDSRGDADAQREHDRGHDREPRRMPQRANPVQDVPPHRLDDRFPTAASNLVLDCRGTAKLDAGGPGGVLRRQARSAVFFRGLLNVFPHLVVEMRSAREGPKRRRTPATSARQIDGIGATPTPGGGQSRRPGGPKPARPRPVAAALCP